MQLGNLEQEGETMIESEHGDVEALGSQNPVCLLKDEKQHCLRVLTKSESPATIKQGFDDYEGDHQFYLTLEKGENALVLVRKKQHSVLDDTQDIPTSQEYEEGILTPYVSSFVSTGQNFNVTHDCFIYIDIMYDQDHDQDYVFVKDFRTSSNGTGNSSPSSNRDILAQNTLNIGLARCGNSHFDAFPHRQLTRLKEGDRLCTNRSSDGSPGGLLIEYLFCNLGAFQKDATTTLGLLTQSQQDDTEMLLTTQPDQGNDSEDSHKVLESITKPLQEETSQPLETHSASKSVPNRTPIELTEEDEDSEVTVEMTQNPVQGIKKCAPESSSLSLINEIVVHEDAPETHEDLPINQSLNKFAFSDMKKEALDRNKDAKYNHSVSRGSEKEQMQKGDVSSSISGVEVCVETSPKKMPLEGTSAFSTNLLIRKKMHDDSSEVTNVDKSNRAGCEDLKNEVEACDENVLDYQRKDEQKYPESTRGTGLRSDSMSQEIIEKKAALTEQDKDDTLKDDDSEATEVRVRADAMPSKSSMNKNGGSHFLPSEKVLPCLVVERQDADHSQGPATMIGGVDAPEIVVMEDREGSDIDSKEVNAEKHRNEAIGSNIASFETDDLNTLQASATKLSNDRFRQNARDAMSEDKEKVLETKEIARKYKEVTGTTVFKTDSVSPAGTLLSNDMQCEDSKDRRKENESKEIAFGQPLRGKRKQMIESPISTKNKKTRHSPRTMIKSSASQADNDLSVSTPIRPTRKSARSTPTAMDVPDKIAVTATNVDVDGRAIKNLGGIFFPNISDAQKATHLIVDKSQLKRTPKFMIALCKGMQIVDKEWYEKSVVHNVDFLDSSKFLLKNMPKWLQPFETKLCFNLTTSVQRAKKMSSRGQLLLSKFYTYICPKVAGNKAPSQGDFKLILEAAGAKYLKALPSKLVDPTNTLLIVKTKENAAGKRAQLAIHQGAKIISTDDLFSAIMNQKIEIESE